MIDGGPPLVLTLDDGHAKTDALDLNETTATVGAGSAVAIAVGDEPLDVDPVGDGSEVEGGRVVVVLEDEDVVSSVALARFAEFDESSLDVKRTMAATITAMPPVLRL